MIPVSDALVELLGRQGMTAGRAATRVADGIGDGERSRESALSHQPAGKGGASQPMGISGKGRQVNAAAKFTGLHVVVDNSRCMPLRDPTRSAQRGSGIHLVWSN